ncbi:Ldh family oxidoreductase [Geodermatophilus sp. DSM 44513]|uniref:Ldh family oxidoreductase n=1 Tax=Geodermatophilus sp. DSM 44513 TaxID=1528104 RepID=UPI00127246CE|nr:Ldh family oxidoreductase [Geodermatophilus sp. DSM 44513]WNV74156.1 Ldh family oxidoreductase [Geodermatophilus sp. DSM 44513]
MRVPVTTLEEQTRTVLRAWGLAEEPARTAAVAVGYADRAGIDSHGISMLPTYERLLHRGHLVPGARTTTVRETAVTALLDAGGGLGHPAAVAAVRLAGDKAAAEGVGVVSVRNSSHFGAAGHYATLAADRGLIGLVTTSARTVSVVPTRAAVPRLSTNPLAFAAPARRNRPFLLDMSTSTVAVNKVRVHGYADRPLPPGWVLDGDGTAVRDPHDAAAVLAGPGPGGLTPLGGTPEMSSHKGYGLGVVVQVLSATLCGAALAATRAAGDRVDVGHFFLALDPAAFRGDGGFPDDLDELLDLLRATPPADPDLPVLVPGDPEAVAREQRERNGVALPPALLGQLRELCGRAGVPFLLDADG